MTESKYIAAIGMVVIAVIAFAVGLYASPLVFPPAEEDTVWARVTEAGKIIVGTEPGWPPYDFKDEQGNIIGFEIEVMEMIADELDLDVEWRDMGFDAIIPAVQSMEIDLGVSGFSVTPERLEVVQFTMPHSITEGQVIMLQSRANDLGITELESLANLTDLSLTCGTQVATIQGEELDEKAPGVSRTYEDFLLALDDMKRGTIDCVYAETPITSNWILEAEQEAEEPIVVIFRRPYWPVAFVAHKDARILVAKINGALAKIISEGQLDELKQTWKC